MKITPGIPLDADQARATIEALFETGRYADIQISSDGPQVTIRTEPAWFIGKVIVNGVSEPPNQAQMAGVTGLRLGEPFYEDSIAPAESALLGTLRRFNTPAKFGIAVILALRHRSGPRIVKLWRGYHNGDQHNTKHSNPPDN